MFRNCYPIKNFEPIKYLIGYITIIACSISKRIEIIQLSFKNIYYGNPVVDMFNKWTHSRQASEKWFVNFSKKVPSKT